MSKTIEEDKKKKLDILCKILFIMTNKPRQDPSSPTYLVSFNHCVLAYTCKFAARHRAQKLDWLLKQNKQEDQIISSFALKMVDNCKNLQYQKNLREAKIASVDF